MLYDQAKIYVEGGTGGNGSVSFRREAHVPRGGPDGGDGGAGGDVVVVCESSRRDLGAMRGRRHFRAGKGGHGEGSGRDGARGDDVVIAVAPGTEVTGLEGERFDLLEPGQRVVVARGGRGGKGNRRFATSTRQAPRFAERGDPGRSGWIELQLKLLADIGLIGKPNAGKSSLLARLTRADPKVGDYPFTTLEPVLGTLDLGDRQVVLADIPGLIEGAAAGAGLGHEFLAHIERCKLLVHVVEVAPYEGDPAGNYETVRSELAGYGAGLERLPELIALSKADLLPPEEAAELESEWRVRGNSVALSAATGSGLDALRVEIERAHSAGEEGEVRLGESAAYGDDGTFAFEAEHLTYRPGAEEGYSVTREDGAFRIKGRGVELLFGRHDLGNEEALAYLEQRLTEMGIIAALKAAGFESGDEIRVGEEVLELYPAP